jgi:hypothetical protein
MIETIYALCEVQGAPFYVGRTKDVTRRLREHNYSKTKGTEAKYQHIRKLEAEGKQWELVPLAEVGPCTEHYEDFWVYTLLMEGYDLTNMKAGDSLQAAERDAILVMRGKGQQFTTAAEFLQERDREIQEAEARKKAANLIKKTRTGYPGVDLFDWQEPLYSFEKPQDRFMSAGTRALLEKRKKK